LGWALPPIPGDWVIQGGAVGLLSFVALLVFLGWLIPRSTHSKQIAQLERDRDQWREVALKAMGHAEELLPAAHITSQVTRVLAERAAPATPFDVAAVERALGGAAQPPTDGSPG